MMVRLVLAAMLIFILCSPSYSENNDATQIRDKILALALIEDNTKVWATLLSVIDSTDKLGLRDEELINLYTELIDYYIGEGPGEILSEKITGMREKILPFLVEKKGTQLNCLEKYKSLCREDIKERNKRIEYLIDAIKKGVILYAEYPESLREEIIKNINVVRIFIEDYKKVNGTLPKDLDVLRKYVWDMYGYKLQIWNPWVEQGKINYKLQKDGKYILNAGFETR